MRAIIRGQRVDGDSKKPSFRTFYKDAHAVECLTEREKMLMGLAVSDDAAVRSVSGAAPCGRKETKAGMTEEELDAAVDVIAGSRSGGCCSRSIRE